MPSPDHRVRSPKGWRTWAALVLAVPLAVPLSSPRPAGAAAAFRRGDANADGEVDVSWCKWEYDEGFGVVEHRWGDLAGPAVDAGLLDALGVAPGG